MYICIFFCVLLFSNIFLHFLSRLNFAYNNFREISRKLSFTDGKFCDIYCDLYIAENIKIREIHGN